MKPGRNDPCHCGSGKKYKKCCYLATHTKDTEKLLQLLDSDDYIDDDLPYFDDCGDDELFDPDDDNDENMFDEREAFFNAMQNVRKYLLKRKPHIREYYKIRDMHGDIVNSMAKYHHDGMFEQKLITDLSEVSEIPQPKKIEKIHLIECNFDLDTRAGSQGFYDTVIYKMAKNVSCITEDFIQKNRYRKPEKITFLHSMVDSKLGLFEITGTDFEEGYVHLKEVFTGAEYTIIDIGLSSQKNHAECYIYTRIITYNGISFSTGLNFLFTKTDGFIKNHIRQHRKDYHPDGEYYRFSQLYNRYSKYPDKIMVVRNTF
jgi:hypothetical protein